MNDRPYHHGNLRQAILTAALDVVADRGPDALSLRDLARRAGVSHAAPAHHFKDRTGLLTAIAVEGHKCLAEALAEGPADLAEVGVRYVRFALDHPAHFAVMFRPDLYDRDATEVVAARERTSGLLRERLGSLPGDTRGPDADIAAVAAWSIAHGFATLWNGGNLHRLTDGRDAADAFRDVTGLLFAGAHPRRRPEGRIDGAAR